MTTLWTTNAVLILLALIILVLALVKGRAISTAFRNPTVLFLVIALPLASVVIYQYLKPDNLEHILSGEMPASDQKLPGLDIMVKKLEAKLAQEPGNGEGWLLLARSYMEIGEYHQAVTTYEKTFTLIKPDNNMNLDYAEALMSLGDASLSQKIGGLLDESLKNDPLNTKGLWMAGFLAYQEKRLSDAISFWNKLLTQLAADSEDASFIQEYIDKAKSEIPE